MDITPLIGSDRQVIQSYGPGRFRISGTVHEGPVIVFPDRTIAWPDSQNFDALTSADLDVVLFGCGADLVTDLLPRRQALKAQGIPAEIMTTAAACRTYNVLMSEGRRVAAALIPV